MPLKKWSPYCAIATLFAEAHRSGAALLACLLIRLAVSGVTGIVRVVDQEKRPGQGED